MFVCILQTLFEPIQAATYDFYTSRSSEAGLEALIGRGVTGLAPEPAYGAAHIIGLSMLMATFQKPSFNVIISVLLILFKFLQKITKSTFLCKITRCCAKKSL